MEAKMTDTALFPRSIAIGKAFFNRKKEKKKLKNNILANRHTLLTSPRRYGKTSLIWEVIRNLKYPDCKIDFFAVTDEISVRDAIFDGIGYGLPKLLPRGKLLLERLSMQLKRLNPKIEISLLGQKISFIAEKSVPLSIKDILLGLDALAVQHNKKVVVLIDEFQQLATLKNASIIEGAIRHAVQQSQNICYLFSGSNRHLLSSIFDDPSRPFYHLCDRINIERITQEDYIPYLQEAAKEKWHAHLNDQILDAIFAITECHAYYMNVLCSEIWQLTTAPTIEDITDAWENYIYLERERIVKDIVELSPNQRSIMNALARFPTNEPTGKEFLTRTRLSSASANLALKTLVEKDYIYYNKRGEVHIVDPAIKKYLCNSSMLDHLSKLLANYPKKN
jgi:AAA+ ATPase superfamily predicted ATPase